MDVPAGGVQLDVLVDQAIVLAQVGEEFIELDLVGHCLEEPFGALEGRDRALRAALGQFNRQHACHGSLARMNRLGHRAVVQDFEQPGAL